MAFQNCAVQCVLVVKYNFIDHTIYCKKTSFELLMTDATRFKLEAQNQTTRCPKKHTTTSRCSPVAGLLFTTVHGMQTWSSDENSVCPSVKHVNCDKTGEKSAQIFTPYERSFSLVFWEEWLVGRPHLPEILGQPAPIGAKSLIFNR